MYEEIKLIKRKIWVAECECGEKDVRTNKAPREKLCKCGKWILFKEESYTGKDLR